jgi:hypothetical protein
VSDTLVYDQIFEYLRLPFLPEKPSLSEIDYLREDTVLTPGKESAVLFGRADELLALAAGDLIVANMIDVLVITGGVGKDSGNLLKLGYKSEADFVYRALQALTRAQTSMELPDVLLEQRANNGRLNAHNSVKLLDNKGYDLHFMTAIAHATSLRRLAATLEFAAEKKTLLNPVIHRKPTDYEFHSNDTKDQKEAAMELLILADWPDHGVFHRPADLPRDLVDIVRERFVAAPPSPSLRMSRALSYLPKSLQIRAFQQLAGQSTAYNEEE